MLRKKGLTRYNPFKEFPTKDEEGENILTKIRLILFMIYDIITLISRQTNLKELLR